jgi:hypothetical protein
MSQEQTALRDHDVYWSLSPKRSYFYSSMEDNQQKGPERIKYWAKHENSGINLN